MKTTRTGNIKIEINPDRHYKGQFIGYEYYKLTDLQKAFPFITDFASLSCDEFDLGVMTNNTEMIQHYVKPYRTQKKKLIRFLKWIDSIVQDKKYLSELKELESGG